MLAILSLLLAAPYLAASDPVTQSCPDNWILIDSTCYWFSGNILRNWANAQQYCGTVGGSLGGTASRKTLAELESLFDSTFILTWTGLTRQNGTSWHFVDGSPTLGLPWARNEPAAGRGECGAVRKSQTPDDNGYLALGCSYSQPFICSQKLITCPDKNITGSYGFISSPNYPNNYENHEHCVQRIIAQDGHFISLQFDDWIVQKDKDYLLIYDGYYPGSDIFLLANLTFDPTNQTTSPIKNDFQTRSNMLSTVFVTDFLINYKGWHAAFRAYTPTTPVYQTGDIGTLTSPNYPNNYPNDVEQYQFVTAPNNTKILATFISFAVEGFYNDYVVLYDGPDDTYPVLANASGILAGVPGPVITSSNSLTLYFFTNSAINFKGFSIDWSAF